MPASGSDRQSHRTWIRQARAQSEEADRHLAEEGLVGRPTNAPLRPDLLPGYALETEIHRGGQGTIYRAKQLSTGRRVAVKMLHDHAFSGPLDRARFERETRVLAALHHPNIVAIHDGGSHDGRFFLVMDYIAGQPLDVYVASQPRSIRETIELFIQICDAVNAAHIGGIIHRDLKPANVRVDAEGRAYVLDFGLAKFAVSPPNGAGTEAPPALNMTLTGQFLGSLPWAAPEQADGSPSRIDTRTDVYALGVLLYQMLTAKFPYRVVGNVRSVLDNIVKAQPVRPRALNREIDDELETIILKCLSKERERRYQTAGELSRDLRRYLQGEPIEAKRDSGWYVMRKTLHRYRVRVAVASAFLLLILGASIVLTILYARQGRLLGEVQQERDKALAAETLADERLRRAENESYVANIAAAAAAIGMNDGGAALPRLNSIAEPLRNWEWRYLVRQADQSIATWFGPPSLMTGEVQLSPDGRFIAASYWMEGGAGALRVWPRDAYGKSAEPALSIPNSKFFKFLDEGNQLLLSDEEGIISRFDLAKRRPACRDMALALADGERALRFTADGHSIVIVSEKVYRTCGGADYRQCTEILLPQDAQDSTFSLECQGSRTVWGYQDGTIAIRAMPEGRILAQHRVHQAIIYGAALSPDGRYLAIATGEIGELSLWELAPTARHGDSPPEQEPLELRLVRRLHDGSQRVGGISFSSDGRLLAAPSADKTVRLWTIPEGRLVATLLGHASAAICSSFSPDGRALVTGDREGVVKLWDLKQPGSVRSFRDLPGMVHSIAFLSDNQVLAMHFGTAFTLDVTTGRILRKHVMAQEVFDSVLFGPTRSQVAISAADGGIHIRDIGSQLPDRLLGTHKSAAALAGDSTGRLLVSASVEELVFWDCFAGRESRRLAGPGRPVHGLAFNRDASRLAMGLRGGELAMMDVQTGRRSPILIAHQDTINSIAFSPDGRFLATGSDDRTVKLWDLNNEEVVWTHSPHLGDVWCVEFSPDGTRLAAAGRDRSVRILDAATGQELLSLRGPTGTIMCLAFSPDGQSIAAGSWAREVFIWNAGPALATQSASNPKSR